MKSKTILIVIPSLLIVVFCLLAWRTFHLQYVRADHYAKTSQRQQNAVITQSPQRGIIVDRRNRILAASNIIETVFAEPRAFADVDRLKDTAARLQPIIDIGGHKISELIHESSNPGFVKIKSPISASERDQINTARMPAIGVQSSWQRYYPMHSLTSHIVGFVGVDQLGLDGVELIYNKKLKGKPGRDIFVVDAFRKPLSARDTGEQLKDGAGMILTIDSVIQQFVRAALVKQVKAYNAESATAIVMDPYTGAILAMVSIPDYDPAAYSKATPDQLRNRVLTDPFEPGSIFKPIVAAIALDSGLVTTTQTFYCEKGNYHGKGFGRIGEWGDHRFEDLTVKQILIESSNIGMAKIGQKLGKKKLYDGVKLFGFGAKTGIDLPGEDSGILRPLKKWDGYSVTRIPYGHEINVTALQIARAYCVLANGGSMVTPYLLRGVFDDKGDITKFPPKKNLAGKVINPDIANWIVRHALTGVVNEGTGKEAKLEKWQLFGKTGTANIATAGQYDETNYVTSFAGGGPAENPAVVVVVSIRKPDKSLKKGYSGGRVAAPVFGEIMKKTLTYLQGQ